MFRLFKKTLAVCLIGFGLRITTCDITSFFWLDIYNWSSTSSAWNSMDNMLKQTLR